MSHRRSVDDAEGDRLVECGVAVGAGFSRPAISDGSVYLPDLSVSGTTMWDSFLWHYRKGLYGSSLKLGAHYLVEM